MLDPNRKLNLNTNIDVKVEADVAEALGIMAKYTGISANEIVNTAMRRFIVTHKDYFPADDSAKKVRPR